MKITDAEVRALVAWVNEGDRLQGTTAWGLFFDAAMGAARSIRDRECKAAKKSTRKVVVKSQRYKDPCHYCGAGKNQPCTSASGKQLKKPHAARLSGIS